MAAVPAAGQQNRRAPALRVFTGVGVTAASDLRIRQPGRGTDLTFRQIAWEHKSLSTEWTRDSVPYVGARAEFFVLPPSWLGISVDVLHFKVFAPPDQQVRVSGTDAHAPVDQTARFGQFVEQYQVSNGVNLVLGNLQVHRPLRRSARFPDGRVDLYAGGGAGVTVPYTRSQIDSQRHAGYDWGRLATQVLGGVTWHGSPRWDTLLEYKYTRTTVDGRVAGGDSLSVLGTHHLVFGLGLHLRR
ncbi:MAG: hypothetical protein O3A25_16500 [Acidobacteria bacterium]|nr:hypothetical protein [Acidobacteriota bacterium]